MSERIPSVAILKTDGINCDMEMAYAFEVGGAKPEQVHVNELREGSKHLADYQALAIPGGFSYGDDIASGAVLANELTSYLGDQLREFADDQKPILGVCNGFQVLVRTGLLPEGKLGEQKASLTTNSSGKFICKWVDLKPELSVSLFGVFPGQVQKETIPMQIAHGEGRFVGSDQVVADLNKSGQIVFRYDDNPNGSMENIAGVCDPNGLILGMMPHPERSIAAFHPDRSRTDAARNAADLIFRKIVNYAKEM